MPSVMVGWGGRCTDPRKRGGLTRKLIELGGICHSLFDPPLPIARAVTGIAGRILVSPHLFLPKEEAEAAGKFIELAELELSGVEFRFFDPRNIYKGEDRISFVFAELPGRPETTGTIVQIEPKALCALYDDPAIKAADHLVRRANIHLRYYCEDWMDSLLGFVKHYYVPDMEYWRYENLSGYGRYLGLDPSDEGERERQWNSILASFMQEARQYLGKGHELRARLDHMNRTGIMPPSWAFAPYSPIEARLVLERELARKLPRQADRKALLSAAKLAIIKSRKGFDLFYLSFRFGDLVVAVSSKLEGANTLSIRADVAPDDRLRAIAETEAKGAPARPVKLRRRQRK